MKEINSLWGEALEGLKNKLSRPSLDLIYQNTKPLRLEEGKIYIEVPSQSLSEQIKLRHSQVLKQTLQDLLEREVAVEFVVGQKASPAQAPPPVKKVGKKEFPHSSLNPRYTFQSFVVGQSNRLCQAAALAVSEAPGRAYNPLFIYGGVGLGKTHLMHAVGNKIVQEGLSFKVVYITSERFTNELIAAIRTDSTLDFQRKYRSVDVLLIDDIQFLIGKERTQEEFFHTFNALHEARHQIVISSDRPPKELIQLEERLTSRFQWGLTADIKPPDYETRVAILQRKVAEEKMHVPDDVIHFIAESFTNNIRDLEGALTRLFAESITHGRPIDLALAEDSLQIFHQGHSPRLNMQRIIDAVSLHYNIPKEDMTSAKRSKEIATARQVAMFIARRYGNISLIHIAHACGKKDHTTVMHACEKIQNLIKKDPHLARDVETIMQNLGINRG